MTEQETPLAQHVNAIQAHVEQITRAVVHVMAAEARNTEPPASAVLGAVEGVTGILGSVATSLAIIADSVGRLVEQGERDFEKAVLAEAENVAAVKQEETKKRSFIGAKSK